MKEYARWNESEREPKKKVIVICLVSNLITVSTTMNTKIENVIVSCDGGR